MVLVLAVLAGIAVWLNRTDEDETASDASQMVYASAEVTAVLSDNAQEDFQNAEGRRVGDQELEIRILSGDHKDEIMTVTNYMSALFNVDVGQGDRIIVRIMTDEEGSAGRISAHFFRTACGAWRKKGRRRSGRAPAYSRMYLVYPDPVPDPGRSGNTGDHRRIGGGSGGRAYLFKRLFEKDAVCGMRLRGWCARGRDRSGSSGNPFAHERF